MRIFHEISGRSILDLVAFIVIFSTSSWPFNRKFSSWQQLLCGRCGADTSTTSVFRIMYASLFVPRILPVILISAYTNYTARRRRWSTFGEGGGGGWGRDGTREAGTSQTSFLWERYRIIRPWRRGGITRKCGEACSDLWIRCDAAVAGAAAGTDGPSIYNAQCGILIFSLSVVEILNADLILYNGVSACPCGDRWLCTRCPRTRRLLELLEVAMIDFYLRRVSFRIASRVESMASSVSYAFE